MTTRTHLRRATRCSSAQPRRHVETRGQRDATFAQVLQPPTGNENDPADRRQGALLGTSAVPCYTMLRGIPGFPNLALRSRPRAAHERWARATESAGVLSAQCRRRVRAPKRRPDGNVRTGACDYQSRYSDYPYPSPDYPCPCPDYPYNIPITRTLIPINPYPY